MRAFPFTLRGIKRYGVEKWLEDFALPVHAEEYQKVSDAMLHAFAESLPGANCNEPLRDICLACYKIHMDLSYFFFESLIYHECRKAGFTHISCNEDVEVSEALRMLRESIRLKPLDVPGVFAWGRELWRSVRLNWGSHSPLEALFPREFSSDRAYVVGNRNHAEIQSYLNERQIKPLSVQPYLYLANRYRTIDSKTVSGAKKFCDDFFRRFKGAYEDVHGIMDEGIKHDCLNYLVESVKDFNSMFAMLSPRKPAGELLIVPIGNLLLRLFACAWRRHGGRVAGVSHGNSYAECNPLDILNGSHSILDRYVASSDGDRKLQAYERQRHVHALVSRVELVAPAKPHYRGLFERFQKTKPVGGTVRTVLLSGYPMDGKFYNAWPSLNTLTYCHFELNVIRALKEAGFRVIYKAHPDTVDQTRHIFPQYADEYMTENFTEVYHKADCILFLYPVTTAFGYSLMTNFPVVSFCENDLWHPELLPLVKKRCILLPMRMDFQSRVVFDKHKLVDAIQNAPGYTNHEVVRRFALDEKADTHEKSGTAADIVRREAVKGFYAYGLQGIKAYGIEKWLVDYTPVLQGTEFQKVYEIIFNAYADGLLAEAAVKSELYWSAAVNYKLITLLSEAFFRHLCLMELKNKGYCDVFVENISGIDDALSAVADGAITGEQRYHVGPLEKLLEALRMVRLNCNSYGLSKAMSCLLPEYGCCLITDPEYMIVKTYVEEKGLSPICLRPSLSLPDVGYIKNNMASVLPDAERFISGILKAASSKDSRFEPFFAGKLQGKVVGILARTMLVFRHMRKSLEGKKLGTLLVQSVTSPESRILSAAWKDLGGTTIGFSHGNGYLTSFGGSDVNNGTHLVIDKYVVSSKGEKEITEYIRGRMCSPLASDDEILALNNPYYRQIYDEMKFDPEVVEIRKIMFVGYPADYHYDPYLIGHDTLSCMHLSLSIIKELKEAGYHVVYKAHPDTLSRTNGFFDAYVDEYNTDDFNQVFKKADCIFFPTPYSTTFGFSMLTKKPIVYVNNTNFDFWHPELKRLLDRRAAQINVTSDDKGVLRFSSEDLLSSIKSSLTLKNNELIEKFALA